MQLKFAVSIYQKKLKIGSIHMKNAIIFLSDFSAAAIFPLKKKNLCLQNNLKI